MKLVAMLGIVTLAGCPSPKGGERPYPEPKVADVLAQLAKQRSTRTSFTAASKMDYWLGSDRLKGDVLVMGTTGKKVRFNALSPAGGDVLVDMACNGDAFAYVDKQNNCQLTGPCDRSSLAAFLRIELEPEDFLSLAVGTPPVLADATGTVTWDGDKGYERVKLSGAGGTQTITIDAREGRYDVIDSELKDPSGKVVWSVENTDFENAADAAAKPDEGRARSVADGGAKVITEHRLPTKTRFKSPQEKADLVVEWGERTINPQIDAAKFTVAIPDGLPRCGATKP